MGRPCLYLELDIWDADARSVPAGERGEIVMRGPKIFKGYWRDEQATAAAFAGGWFHTGDIGRRDDDGYLFIVDRLKDMIISGGENVAGSEVERVLYEHDAVLEAAVVAKGRLPKRLRDRAPRIVETRRGHEVWEFEGNRHYQAGMNAIAGAETDTVISLHVGSSCCSERVRQARERFAFAGVICKAFTNRPASVSAASSRLHLS